MDKITWTYIDGKTRVVCHFLRLLKESEKGPEMTGSYTTAIARARKIGGKKYHNKAYGGGIVFDTTDTANLEKQIFEITKE
jgi:hypothetical protein